MRRQRAFTVIEAVAAVVVIGVAIPPMLWGVKQAHAYRSSQLLASKARWLAAERLEDIIADRHSTTRGYTYVLTANYPAEAQVSGFANFSRSVSVQETGADLASPGAGYKSVTCSVGYKDGTGTTRSLAITTVLTDYNP
jgi:type II secretory pathway pseudopilin PulG